MIKRISIADLFQTRITAFMEKSLSESTQDGSATEHLQTTGGPTWAAGSAQQNAGAAAGLDCAAARATNLIRAG